MIRTVYPKLSRIRFPGLSSPRNNKGTYILIIEMPKTRRIKAGKLPKSTFPKGTYLYIGRSRSSLQARLKRHLSHQKKIHWHIDFLLKRAHIMEIWIRENFFDECGTARRIRELFPSVLPAQNGFGSSDCRCPGHLLYSPGSIKELESLRQSIMFEKVKSHGNHV
jgi:Uri superfamily endonuclease